jgi:hypothetical protein
MSALHRPVVPGIYECRFRTTGDHVLSLYWDGRALRTSPEGKRVVTSDLLAWRGWLA